MSEQQTPPVLVGLPVATIEVDLRALNTIRERYLALARMCADLQEQTGTITSREMQNQIREDDDLWLTLQGMPPLLPADDLGSLDSDRGGIVVDGVRVILLEDVHGPGAPSAWVEYAEQGVHQVNGWAVWGPEAERGTLPATAYAASLREAVVLGRELLRLRANRVDAERAARHEHDEMVAGLVARLQGGGA